MYIKVKTPTTLKAWIFLNTTVHFPFHPGQDNFPIFWHSSTSALEQQPMIFGRTTSILAVPLTRREVLGIVTLHAQGTQQRYTISAGTEQDPVSPRRLQVAQTRKPSMGHYTPRRKRPSQTAGSNIHSHQMELLVVMPDYSHGRDASKGQQEAKGWSLLGQHLPGAFSTQRIWGEGSLATF